MSKHDAPLQDCSAAAGSGYKCPPAKSQWKKGQSGNPSGKKKNKTAKSLKAAVMKAASSSVLVMKSNGLSKKINMATALMESIFHKAGKGDAAAFKILVKWLKEHAPAAPPEMEQKQATFECSIELTQIVVDLWKEDGFLPADFPDKIEDIDVDLLNQVIRTQQRRSKMKEKLSSEV